jgi:hypothetical protein
MLAGCEVEPMGVDQARQVDKLAGRASHDDVVDATVAEGV